MGPSDLEFLEGVGDVSVSTVTGRGTTTVASAYGSGGLILARSGDEGATWTPVEGLAGAVISEIVATESGFIAAGVVVGGDAARRPIVLVGDPTGARWTEEVIPDEIFESSGDFTVSGVAAGPFPVVWGYAAPRYADPDRCYTDLAMCRRGARSFVVVKHRDGQWQRLDLTLISPDPYFGIADIVFRADGRLAVLTTLPDVLDPPRASVAHWWSPDPDARPPSSEPPVVDPPPIETLVVDGATLEPGVLYRYPFVLDDCATGFLGTFNGRSWAIESGPLLGLGSWSTFPEEWPVAESTIFGYMTFSSDVIEYSVPNEGPIATFRPADDPPPVCGD